MIYVGSPLPCCSNAPSIMVGYTTRATRPLRSIFSKSSSQDKEADNTTNEEVSVA